MTRPLRPLFPKDLRNEVQIIITALSADHINPPDILAIVGASAALTISDVPFGVAPFSGPIGAVRVGLIDGEFVLNTTYEQMAVSKLDLRLAGTREAVLWWSALPMKCRRSAGCCARAGAQIDCADD
ncbi:polyribonucleotide nucleotidyltransferase [Anaerolineaceae bacterium]|nr:polyribonucleotide nucleotidyltransferase [Anaerolineaceae bacterium]